MRELSYQKLKKICLDNTADVKTMSHAKPQASTSIARRYSMPNDARWIAQNAGYTWIHA